MKIAIASAAVAAVIAAGTTFFLLRDDDNEGNIVVYRDEANVCKTITTPYLKVSKGTHGKVKWKIRDGFDCVTDDLPVILKFDKGDADPLPDCVKEGTNKIECSLDDVTAPIPARGYSVWLGGTETEDPELQIEM